MEVAWAIGAVILCAVILRKVLLGGALATGLYPPIDDSPYSLPWGEGKTYFCFQGNDGFLSHKGRTQFAWDFLMFEGTAIHASRGGSVALVVDFHEGRGKNKRNNEIYIDHGDGTSARYAHIQKNGSRVRAGQSVRQGELIALSGDVGKSLGPHLHFEVVNQEHETIPVSFRDVKMHQGVPRTGYFYRRPQSQIETR